MLSWMLIAAGCGGFDSGDLPDLAPIEWKATITCETSVPLAVEEPIDVTDGWSCMALKPRDRYAWIRCWRDDAEFEVAGTCGVGSTSSMAYIDECKIKLDCSGAPL